MFLLILFLPEVFSNLPMREQVTLNSWMDKRLKELKEIGKRIEAKLDKVNIKMD
jgi:hypothetical protein